MSENQTLNTDKSEIYPAEFFDFVGQQNLTKIEELSPVMQQKTLELYRECQKQGLFFDIVSGRRTFEEEAEIYNLYADKFPTQVSIPGKSQHELGEAIDIIVDNNVSMSTKYAQIGKIWQALGGYWGGNGIDEYWHFALSSESDLKSSVVFSWSGGKDSALALHKLLQDYNYSVQLLFTTLSEEYKRVNFHAIPPELLNLQAESIGIPLYKAFISKSENIEEYAQKLESHITNTGIKTFAYGDIYLEDLRNFRISCLNKLGLNSIYPIWKTDTMQNLQEFINLGFKAILTCVDTNVLDKSFLGREINEQFINDLPIGVDACGENGEFHTFVYDGPIFKVPVDFKRGQSLQFDNFCYLEILPLV